MALPELEAKRVEVELKRFADRLPPQARKQIWYKNIIRGNVVTIFECRPFFSDPIQTTEHAIARFRFNPAKVTWSLHWRDRNQRWHDYEGFERVRSFAALVAEVERDPTHIFFG